MFPKSQFSELSLSHIRGGVELLQGKESKEVLLSQVVQGCSLTILRALLHHGVDIESVDAQGRTPLMLACIHQHGACAEYLLFHGASTASQDDEGKTVGLSTF